jgi:hypothetical protein
VLARGRRPRPIHLWVTTAAASDGGHFDGHGRGCGRGRPTSEALPAQRAGGGLGRDREGRAASDCRRVPEARRVRWCTVELQTDKIGSPAKHDRRSQQARLLSPSETQFVPAGFNLASPPPLGDAAVAVTVTVPVPRCRIQVGVAAAARWRCARTP